MSNPNEDEESKEKRSKNSCAICWNSGLEKIVKSLKWIRDDFRKPHLIWVKIIFTLQSLSLVSLYPFLIVHLRSLGLTIEDASIVNIATPWTDVCGPPLAGFIADKLGNFKVFMATITFVNGLASLLLLSIKRIDTLNEVELCCSKTLENVFCFEERNFTHLDSTTNFVCSFKNGKSIVPDFIVNPQTSKRQCETKLYCSIEDSSKDSINLNIRSSVFWHYLSVRLLLDVFKSSSIMLFEGAVVAIIKEQSGDYGLQRLMGTIGAILFAPVSGKLVDMYQETLGPNTNKAEAYMPVIILYFALRTLSALSLMKLNLSFKPKAKTVLKDMGKVFFNAEVLSFLVAFFVAGFLWGFLDNFLFWLMEDLGATKFLMGTSLSVGTIVGIPLNIASGYLIQKMGYHNVALLSLILYAIRLTGYTYMSSPELFLIFEILKPISTTLLFNARDKFIEENSLIEVISSVTGILEGGYGVGKRLGGILGGFAVGGLGSSEAFRVFGLVAACSALVYKVTIEANFYIKKKRTKKPENVPLREIEEQTEPFMNQREPFMNEGGKDSAIMKPNNIVNQN